MNLFIIVYIIYENQISFPDYVSGTKTETRERAARACFEASADWKGEAASRAEAATGTSTQTAANDDRQK